MIRSYKAHSFINGLRFSCVNSVKANKAKIIVATIFILIAIATGVFVAIRSNLNDLCNLREISLSDFYSGFVASASAFGSRCFSLLVNVLVLIALSFSPYLFPLSLFLFVYRAYLFGLNFALIFIFYGIGSAFTAVVIILPCQVVTLFALLMFYLILVQINHNCKKFGGADCNRLIFVFIGFLILLLINLTETTLLLLLSGRVIMVI